MVNLVNSLLIAYCNPSTKPGPAEVLENNKQKTISLKISWEKSWTILLQVYILKEYWVCYYRQLLSHKLLLTITKFIRCTTSEYWDKICFPGGFKAAEFHCTRYETCWINLAIFINCTTNMMRIIYSQSKTGFVVFATRQLDIGNGISSFLGFQKRTNPLYKNTNMLNNWLTKKRKWANPIVASSHE